MRKRLALLALGMFVVGCAPLAREHKGNAAFASALAAQIGHDEPRAESLYREILALGLDWSPVWNNLAVIAVHRHEYPAARKLLAHAVAANARDVVALTNYGVISYHLSDYAEARKTLEEARRLRIQLIDSIPSNGRTSWEEDQYARVTAPLDETAKRYLARIDAATISDAPLPAADLMADLHVVDTLPKARF
ncbi:MAG TPA: tetratricopeptide repeat protein [Polyangia bacterium]|jgi:tetratricopeptide (TPR) repeat protein